MNLFLFTSTETPAKSSIKSPKNFEEPNGVVGLGILVAMNTNSNDEYCSQDPFFKRTAILANSPRSLSNPIPILSRNKSTSFSAKSDKSTTDTKRKMNVEEMELCEEYTCVISHIGDNQIKKKEYFDSGWSLRCSTNTVITGTEKISADSNSNSIDRGVSSGVVSASSAVSISHGGETPTFPVADFLNSCFLCKKQLHGLDIFMYRYRI